MSEKPTLPERYVTAAEASSLALKTTTGPVDVLMAAGLSAQGNVMRGAALVIHRMRESGRHAPFKDVVEVLTDWLVKESRRNRSAAGLDVGRKKRMVARVVFWWMNQTCPHCHGRGHPLIANTPYLDESRKCEHCLGTGKVPLERAVQHEHITMARILVNELERATNDVFGAAARKLR